MNINQLMNLEDKIALVTGGAGNVGIGIVEGLAEAGATVITASRKKEANDLLSKKMQNDGLKVHSLHLDQADHQSVLSLKDKISEQFGKLDVFVNNAFALPMLKYSDPLSDWEKSMKINATGSFDVTREMADLISQNGGGSIINISSMKALFSPDFELYEGTEMDSPPDYNFHKGGLIALTKYLARKLAPQKIRINSISPGGFFNNQPKAFLDRYNCKVPLGRMANKDDIKGLVVLLASEASAYITGENILMDGGLHA